MSKYLRKTPEQLAQEMLAISQALELMNKEEAEALGTISKRYVDSISEPKKAEAYLKFLDQYATKEEKKRLKNRINILKKLAKQDDTDSKQLVVDDKNANKIQPASHQTMALDRQIVKENGINYNNNLTTNLVDNQFNYLVFNYKIDSVFSYRVINFFINLYFLLIIFFQFFYFFGLNFFDAKFFLTMFLLDFSDQLILFGEKL